MDLSFSARQNAVARSIGECGQGDALLAALVDLVIAQVEDDDMVARSIAVAEAARHGMIVPLGLALFVSPLFTAIDRHETVALVCAGEPQLARHAAQATTVIVLEGEVARAFRLAPEMTRAVRANMIYPVAEILERGEQVGEASANVVLERARIALSAEMVGVLDSGLDRLVAFLKERRQFGRPLAAFQAVQHRLAEMAVDLETARWLSREAAWAARGEEAAIAAAYGARTTRRHCREIHQLSGARGFTLELGLAKDSLRMHFLSTELGGARSHETDAAASGVPA